VGRELAAESERGEGKQVKERNASRELEYELSQITTSGSRRKVYSDKCLCSPGGTAKRGDKRRKKIRRSTRKRKTESSLHGSSG